MSAPDDAARQATVPATAMQESMWWIHHRAKIKSVYNLTWRLACDSAVDPAALAAAWQAVHDRHDALRGGLTQQDGSVGMFIEPAVLATPEHVVVADPGPASPDTLLELIAGELHDRPFQLSHPPLTRLALVTVAGRPELIVTVHHSMIDGWGLQLLLTDLSAAYAAARGAAPSSPPTDPASFADYCRRSQAAQTGGRWQAGTKHWRNALRGATATTVLADRPRTQGTGDRGAVLRFVLSRGACEGIAAQAAQVSATPFAVLLAAFQTVLARGGAGSDVAIGIATANRLTQRDQALVGYTSNLCISRGAVCDEDLFAAVVARARDELWTMLAYQDVPFPLVFGALDGQDQARLGDIPPLLLSYYGPIGAGLRLGDVALDMMPSPNRAARSDLSFGLYELDGRQAVEVEYNVGRYDRETVLALLADLDAVLTAARQPGRVGDLTVATRAIAIPASPAHPEAAAATGGPDGAAGPGKPTEANEPEPEPDEAGTLELAFRLWADVLGEPPSDADEDFFAVSGRSLKAVQLTAAVEAESGQEFDVETWLATATPRQLARQLAPPATTPPIAALDVSAQVDPVAEDAAGSSLSTLIELRGGTDLHAHLLPGAGASADWYRELLAALPGGWRVTASQEREPLDSVGQLAARYRADLDTAGLRPDLLVGWSLGGQVAHQLAVDYGDPAPDVVLLDSPPPVGYPIGDDGILLPMFAATLLGALGVPPDAAPPQVTGDDAELSLRVLTAYLAAIGQPLPLAVLTQRWEAYRRHARAAAAHRSERRVDAAALVVAAELADEQLGQWAELFDPPPSRLRVAADHFGLLRHPVAAEIAAAIQAAAKAAVRS
jgi:pimeloyl-ACP methyl ester carboxylesterase